MSENVEKGAFFSSIIKAAALSVIVSLVGALIFALVLSFTNLDSGVIKTVNQFIKILAVFLGCFFFIKDNAGLFKGLISGALSAFITYLIFALISGVGINFGAEFFIDLAFTAVIGAISGIIAVNVKKD
ncbi:MAG: TIGR04086 family membrane protein [Clostridiales bacterium]|nr:TIGR04086 family membrane protein [Clostridiales bacterium]